MTTGHNLRCMQRIAWHFARNGADRHKIYAFLAQVPVGHEARVVQDLDSRLVNPQAGPYQCQPCKKQVGGQQRQREEVPLHLRHPALSRLPVALEALLKHRLELVARGELSRIPWNEQLFTPLKSRGFGRVPETPAETEPPKTQHDSMIGSRTEIRQPQMGAPPVERHEAPKQTRTEREAIAKQQIDLISRGLVAVPVNVPFRSINW